VTALPRQHWRALLALCGLGLLVRLLVAATTDGVTFDLQSFHAVDAALRSDGFGIYGAIQPARWPYPPGYFPWVLAAGEIGQHVSFDRVIRLPPMAADVGIALVVQDLLGRFGAAPWRRVAAAAVVLAGPIFVGVAGYNGQLDPVAILPALLALWVWTKPGVAHRALYAGVLIGLAASLKTVPALMVLALAPSARSWREAAVLAGAAVGTLALIFAPFVIATPHEALRVFSYHGVPGFGGISWFAQPSFPHDVLAGRPVTATDGLLFMRDHGHQAILWPALAALAAFFAWRRPDPVLACVLLWLTVWVFGVNFFLQYLVWGLPFLLVRGHLAAAAAIQLALTPALLLVYNAPVGHTAALLGYTVPIVAAWLAGLGALALLVLRTRSGRGSTATARPGAPGMPAPTTGV
jgi:hypothetical protein